LIRFFYEFDNVIYYINSFSILIESHCSLGKAKWLSCISDVQFIFKVK